MGANALRILSLIILFVTNVFVFFVEDNMGGVSFKITERGKCADKETAIFVQLNSAIGQCAQGCARRSDCVGFNYRRTFRLCEFFASSELVLYTNSHQTGYCVYIQKVDISDLRATGTCDCIESQLCDVVSNKCIERVCPTVNLRHGVIFGNMYEVGSRIMYTCDANYQPENLAEDIVTCKPNGTWSHSPRCLKDCSHPPSLENSLVSSGRTIKGTTRSYTCADKYRFSLDSTISSTTCQDNGQWTSTDFKCIADYRYLGCFQDFDDNRILVDEVFNFPANTNEFCVEFCFSLGFSYAYTESYRWCFCGHETAHEISASESDCNTPCLGDASTKCGGEWRASLFVRNTDANYLGCYNDLNPTRILDGHNLNDQYGMTTLACLAFCRSHGTIYALTEFAKECYCGDNLHTVEKMSDNECNNECTGGSGEFCGGSGKGSLYTTD